MEILPDRLPEDQISLGLSLQKQLPVLFF